MTDCQIHYMDIISDTCSVRCIIVISKYTKAFQLANSNLCDIRHQVIRNTIRIFTDLTALVCTDRVKVTKQDHVPLGICFLDICQDLLQHALCLSIWVCDLTLRAVFRYRYLVRCSVYGCRRREDNVFYPMLTHNIK